MKRFTLLIIMINLYLQNNISPISDIDNYLSRLPQSIQSRILRRKQKVKRDTSLQGYLLLQQALKEDFDADLNQITFLKSGKPVFEGQSISFNISHSGNLIGVAISKSGIIGLDIEQFRRFEKVETSFSFFSKVEQQAILSAKNPQRKLIEFWSKKEALIKAIGGRMFDMAELTDVRNTKNIWQKETYFLYQIQHDFDGFIWVASSFSSPNIVTKTLTFL